MIILFIKRAECIYETSLAEFIPKALGTPFNNRSLFNFYWNKIKRAVVICDVQSINVEVTVVPMPIRVDPQKGM